MIIIIMHQITCPLLCNLEKTTSFFLILLYCCSKAMQERIMIKSVVFLKVGERNLFTDCKLRDTYTVQEPPLSYMLLWVCSLITEQNLKNHRFLYLLYPAADSNIAGEDGFDEKGCHCEISVEDLMPSVKSVIRAVR